MNIMIFIIVTLTTIFASASTKKCSEANLVALLRATGQLVGVMGEQNIQVLAAINETDKSKKPDYAQFRKKYLELANTRAEKSAPLINRIGEIVEKHPECDIDGLFAIKTETKK